MFKADKLIVISPMASKHPTDVSKDGEDDPPSYSGKNDSVLHPSAQEKPHHPPLYPSVESFEAQEKCKLTYACV